MKDLAALAGESDYDAAERVGHRRRARDRPVGRRRVDGRLARRASRRCSPTARELVTLLEEWGPEVTDGRADLVGLLTRLADQHAGLVAVLDGEDESFVYSVALDRRRNRPAEKLVAERLDVGEVLAERPVPARAQRRVHLGDDRDGRVLRALRAQRGARPAATRVRGARCASTSSYDFERQMAVFVPTDIAPPTSAATSRPRGAARGRAHRRWAAAC